jgi:hypothetical protein
MCYRNLGLIIVTDICFNQMICAEYVLVQPVTVAKDMHCLRSLRSRDCGFKSHSGHGCLVFVYVCAFSCVCVQVEALRQADHLSKESY